MLISLRLYLSPLVVTPSQYVAQIHVEGKALKWFGTLARNCAVSNMFCFLFCIMLSEDLVAGGWHKFPTLILLNMHTVRCFPSPSNNTSVDSMYSWFGIIATCVWNICSCTINTHIMHVLHYTILYMYTMCTYVYHTYWTCRYVIYIYIYTFSHSYIPKESSWKPCFPPFSGLQVFPSKNGTFVVALGGGSYDVAFVLAHSFSIVVAPFYLLPMAGSKIRS